MGGVLCELQRTSSEKLPAGRGRRRGVMIHMPKKAATKRTGKAVAKKAAATRKTGTRKARAISKPAEPQTFDRTLHRQQIEQHANARTVYLEHALPPRGAGASQAGCPERQTSDQAVGKDPQVDETARHPAQHRHPAKIAAPRGRSVRARRDTYRERNGLPDGMRAHRAGSSPPSRRDRPGSAGGGRPSPGQPGTGGRSTPRRR